MYDNIPTIILPIISEISLANPFQAYNLLFVFYQLGIFANHEYGIKGKRT